MKLIAQIAGENQEITIKRGESNLYAEIEGRVYNLEVSEPEPNIYLFKNEGIIFELFVSPKENSAEPFRVRVRSEDFDIEIIDPKRLRETTKGVGGADGIVEIKTAMPGKVVRILLKENAEVKEGEGVIIVEAMKMQNEMKSPKEGIIKEIRFAEGDTVNAGDILVIIE